MSFKAQKWTMQHALRMCRTSSTKLVLTALAFHAHPDGTKAYPAAATIAEYLDISLRQVQRALKELEEQGLIVRGDQSHSKPVRSGIKPVVYDLAFWIENKSEKSENFYDENAQEPMSMDEEEELRWLDA